MDDPSWFQRKWGTPQVPTDILFKKIEELEQRIIKLEEENIETTNVLYEVINSTEAIDRRIDIVFEELTK